jgi:hypothetical protein
MQPPPHIGGCKAAEVSHLVVGRQSFTTLNTLLTAADNPTRFYLSGQGALEQVLTDAEEVDV